MGVDADPFAPVHRRRVWRSLVAAAAVLIVAGLAVVVVQRMVAWESRPITEVQIVSERELLVLGHCDRSARVRVDQTATVVVLDLQSRGANRGDCLEGVVVRLDQDVGSRVVTDAFTDAPVVVDRVTVNE